MTYKIQNILDNRTVYKHKSFDRYYVSDPNDCSDNLTLFITKDKKIAQEILESTKEHWSGINVKGWKIIEA